MTHIQKRQQAWPDAYSRVWHQPADLSRREGPHTQGAGSVLLMAEMLRFEVSFRPESGPVDSREVEDFAITDFVHFSDGQLSVSATLPRESLFEFDEPGHPFGSSFPKCEKEAPQRASNEVYEMATQGTHRQNNPESTQGKEKPQNMPVAKFTAGGVQLAVWANDGPKGGTYPTVSFKRAFLRKDGEWDSTTSLRVNDIPKAIAVLQKAYEKLILVVEDLELTNHRSEEAQPVVKDMAEGHVTANQKAATSSG